MPDMPAKIKKLVEKNTDPQPICRGIALIYAHTPVRTCTAEILEKYTYNIIHASFKGHHATVHPTKNKLL